MRNIIFNNSIIKTKGFTLAEVLVTIGIIGVVAAITIPILMNNYQKTQYIAQLKKAYTTANQALISLTNDYGCLNDLKCTNLLATDLVTFGDEYIKYFNVSKNCRNTAGCSPNNNNLNYDGSGTNFIYDTQASIRYTFITTDGTVIYLFRYSNCSSNFSTNATGDLKNVCGGISFDLNGNVKGPNYIGKDVFGFFITQGNGLKLYPNGGLDSNGDTWSDGKYWNGSTKYCSGTSKYGVSCTGRVMEEGWQINY